MKKFSWSITSGSLTIADPLILTEQPNRKWIKRFSVVNGTWSATPFFRGDEIQYVVLTHSSALSLDSGKESKVNVELYTNQMVFVDTLAFSNLTNPSKVYDRIVKSMLRTPPIDTIKSKNESLGVVCTDQMLQGGTYCIKYKKNKEGLVYSFRIDFSPLF